MIGVKAIGGASEYVTNLVEKRQDTHGRQMGFQKRFSDAVLEAQYREVYYEIPTDATDVRRICRFHVPAIALTASGPDQTTTTAPLNTDRPTPTPPGADGGQLTARKDQPLASSPPSTTYDRDAPPDQHHHYQPVGTPCDASGESVPTTAETEKPPGHLEASGPTAIHS
eukprot:SAG11_NODE_6977_length_1215_cov_4.177419_2_plen_169_part_00